MTVITFIGAAICEIAGCYAFWCYFRLNYSVAWLIPGIFSLFGFAFLLTVIDIDFAGRAYASYGAIYIFASLIWMWGIEGMTPNRFDFIGGVIGLIGAGVIVFGSLNCSR